MDIIRKHTTKDSNFTDIYYLKHKLHKLQKWEKMSKTLVIYV